MDFGKDLSKPKHNMGDRTIVNALIQTYNPKSNLKISTLLNEVR